MTDHLQEPRCLCGHDYFSHDRNVYCTVEDCKCLGWSAAAQPEGGES